MEIWEHVVQYYETDQMRIVHHSNYIRWFEEVRSWMLEKIDFSYSKMEETGIIIPVLGVNAEYKSMVHYGDTVAITAKVTQFSGVKLMIAYEVRDIETGELRCTGESKHAFLDKETNRPFSVKRSHKELYDLFTNLVESE